MRDRLIEGGPAPPLPTAFTCGLNRPVTFNDVCSELSVVVPVKMSFPPGLVPISSTYDVAPGTAFHENVIGRSVKFTQGTIIGPRSSDETARMGATSVVGGLEGCVGEPPQAAKSPAMSIVPTTVHRTCLSPGVLAVNMVQGMKNVVPVGSLSPLRRWRISARRRFRTRDSSH